MLHRPDTAGEVKTVVAMMDDIAWHDPKGQEILHALEDMKAQGATIVMAFNKKTFGEAMQFMTAVRHNGYEIGRPNKQNRPALEDMLLPERLESKGSFYDPAHPTADSYIEAVTQSVHTNSEYILMVGDPDSQECQFAIRYGRVTVADYKALLNGEINTLPFTNTSKKSGPT